MTEKLKPCPFCGGDVELRYSDYGDQCWIKCTHCSLACRFEKHLHHSDRTAEAWNQRKGARKAESCDLFNPCPFCGGEATLRYLYNPLWKVSPQMGYVQCLDCGSNGPAHDYSSIEEAAEDWNRRAKEAEPCQS